MAALSISETTNLLQDALEEDSQNTKSQEAAV